MQAALDAASGHVAGTGNTNKCRTKRAVANLPLQRSFFDADEHAGFLRAASKISARKGERLHFSESGKRGSPGPHDIGFAKGKRNNRVTHRIDPAGDAERDNLGSSRRNKEQDEDID